MESDPLDKINIGTKATKTITVTSDLTVAHFHDNMPEVYGTPMMIYLMEVTASQAIGKLLPEGWISVGAAVDIRHLAATPCGFKVTAKAEVIAKSGNNITFEVTAHDGIDTIGSGTHTRTAVNFRRFQLGIKFKEGKRKQD